MYHFIIRTTLCLAAGFLLTTGMSAMADDGDAKTTKKSDDTEMLTIGSKAPSISIEHWVQTGDGKFNEVTDFEDGKVYIVEFWATWCGPCIASMPHISELQDKYAEEGVQVISVSDEDLETVEKFLERDVRGKEDMTYADLTKNYCLTTDPDRSCHTSYMKAAGQNGIPTSFIVGKDGYIEWIGHPMRIDKPLKQVVGGDWDREKFAVKFIAEQKRQIAMGKIMRKLRAGDIDEGIEMIEQYMEELPDGDEKIQLRMLRLTALSRSDNTEKAIAAFDEYLSDLPDGDEKTRVRMLQFSVLVKAGDKNAAGVFSELAGDMKDDPEGLNQIAWSVVEMSDGGQEVSDELVSAALKAAENAAEQEPENGAILDTLAHLVFKKGDLDKAIEIQEKAVENSEGQIKQQVEEFLKELQKKKADK